MPKTPHITVQAVRVRVRVKVRVRVTKIRSDMTSFLKNKDIKIFHYKHYINEFIADTRKLNTEHKYAYLTLIWESYRKKGYINEEIVSELEYLNDISVDVYQSILNKYFQYDDKLGYYHNKIIEELESMGHHKSISSKGGKVTAEKKAAITKLENDFELFWKVYPNNKNKSLAFRKWMSSDDPDILVKSLKVIKHNLQSGEWNKNETKFIPHAATFINQERYNDEVSSKSNNYTKGLK